MGDSGFVLTMASYYGTLAAVRCLGKADVPVIIADAEPYAPALWSCYVGKRASCPPVRSVDAFVAWLLSLGASDPGNVLYATSDDLAWLFALRESELRKHFQLLTPPFSSMASLLDKGALYSVCNEAGLRTPRTWFPGSRQDIARIERQGAPALLVKPRTQVLFHTQRKGSVVTSNSNLREIYEDFLSANRYDPLVLEHQPEVEWPMLQEFCGAPGDPVYGVSGFCDSRHGLFVARATYKLLQWPRRLGVGILFEDAPVGEELARGIQRVCEKTGFYGVFEAEFVQTSDGPMLIDFNPRFFGQMGFDVARELPSPFLVYLAAIGDIARLRTAVETARRWRASGPIRFGNQVALRWTRAAERVVGHALDPWATNGAPDAIRQLDASVDADDWLPGVLDGVRQVAGAVLHPRATLRAAMRRD
jgi:D-aspartate ligase